MSEPAAAVRGLEVVRGGNRILRGIDMEVPAGCVFGLVGPSGSGKTTLIRSVLGRQRVAGGSLRVLGRPAGHADLRRLIGYMPQEPAVYVDLTGRENIEFFAAVYRTAHARVDEVLEIVDLTDVADRPVATYSGGQAQRVALAAALLPAPPLLLLDEPTVGLDPRLRRSLWDRFHEWAAGGTSLVVSTHVMDEAARTDRLALLVDGAVAAEGSPGELVARAGAGDLEHATLQLIERSAAAPIA